MAKAIMIQGTTSNAGKSLVAAALCRIFKEDGFKVAPFKSQNMALNSYITSEGLEMGRAQVVQAEAAKIEPSVNMNPILLKPTNDTGSQVIVNGKSIGNMKAREYFKMKRSLIPDILSAYEKLDREYDIIVIEGAGSPAEINLKSEDIVNMGMAKMAKAPVLLVGDIDRGGVFASLAGTIMLLEEDEKSLVKGLIINKFRGDKKILDLGLLMIEDITKKRVAGCVPYINVDIDDEDSLSDRLTRKNTRADINIGVVRLPRISNFTDLAPLENIENVNLYYINNVGDFNDPDMIIIPGSKNTIGDMLWLRESGLEAMILKMESRGKIIFGICGGYQILGKRLIDNDNVENQGDITGISLLDIETTFQGEKRTKQVIGRVNNIFGDLKSISNLNFNGYEIHMGRSKIVSNETTPFSTIDGNDDGAFKGNVYGTYAHGIFDNKGITENIIKTLYEKKGLQYSDSKVFDRDEYKERQYSILASEVRKSLDMDYIYKILEEGVEIE